MMPDLHLVFLPEIALLVPGGSHRLLQLAALFIPLSLVFFVSSRATARFFPKSGLNRLIPNIFYILSLYFPVSVAALSTRFFLAPLYPALAIALYLLIITLLIVQDWFALRNVNDDAPSLTTFIRTNLWLVVRVTPQFIVPLLLFQQPVFHGPSRTFYWGTPLCMALAYVAYFQLFHKNLHRLIGATVDSGALPAPLAEKFDRILQGTGVKERTDVILIGRGFYNAAVLFPERTIAYGTELLRRLTTRENIAVFTHELGHLKYSQAFEKRRRMTLLSHLLLFFSCTLGQAPVSHALTASVVGIFGALFLLHAGTHKHTLRAEFEADNHVHQTDPDLYPHLVSALEKQRGMSGIPEDLCKQTNAAHLDIDERKRMVENGTFTAPRRGGLSFPALIPVLLIAILSTVLLTNIYTSPSTRWRQLHNRFHKLDNAEEYEQAERALTEALRLSEENFGEKHPKTHKILNDLSDFLIDRERYDEARRFAARAHASGLAVYRDRNLAFARCLRNLGRLHYWTEDYPAAVKWFEEALELQEKLGAKPRKRANTLRWLGASHGHREEEGAAIRRYGEALRIYEAMGEAGYEKGTRTAMRIGSLLLATGKAGEATHHFNRSLHLAGLHHGRSSGNFVRTLLEVGDEYREIDDCETMEQLYLHGLEITRQTMGEASAPMANMLLDLGWLYRDNGEARRALPHLVKAVAIREGEEGPMDAALLEPLWALATTSEIAGDLEGAGAAYKRVIGIERRSEDTYPEDLVESYKRLISVLERMGDEAEAARHRASLAAFEETLSSPSGK